MVRHISLMQSLLSLTVVACGTGNPLTPDRMVGCYALKALEPAGLRIRKDSGQYRVALREGTGWNEEDSPLRAATGPELHDLFGADTTKVIENLVLPEGGFGLFRVRPGVMFLGDTVKSDYVAFLLLGGSAVRKVPCP